MPRNDPKKSRPGRAPRPLLYVGQILAWADAHFARTGSWPTQQSGCIPGTLDEKWRNVDACLKAGCRGLQSGSSIARLLAQHRGIRNQKALPPLPVTDILRWADAYHARTGNWPRRNSGLIPDASGQTWSGVDMALSRGVRTLPNGSSLARLLAEHRGVRNLANLRRLHAQEILRWADAHRLRTGQWPKLNSGAIQETEGETWLAVDYALRCRARGIRKKTSLAQLLAKYRGVRNLQALPKLTHARILQWADSHQLRTGKWPTEHSGPIEEAPGESWQNVETALRQGFRGLPPGSSLARLLAAHE